MYLCTKKDGMNDFKITYEEIPYESLSEFGLTQEMIDDLPEPVLNRLLMGFRTPVLPIRRIGNDGKTYRDKARIRLVATDEGIGVILLPCYKECSIESYSSDEQDVLRDGGVLKVNAPNNGVSFVQLDTETNRLLSAPASMIVQNIKVLGEKLGLDSEVVNHVCDGNVATVAVEGTDVTCGIDLHTETGVRTVEGNFEKWKEVAGHEQLDRYSFGLYGCWIKKDNGDLDYVSEENYTPEILEAQKADIERARNAQGMGY